ncbi:MAG: hypothetical protein K0B16_04270 [Burkholderiaceae bacterium]|nr:hypothetical protein [Burkholderiaceae bacterium]
MHDDHIPQPHPRLSDETAAQLLDFLYELIAEFESAYLVQIQRHRRARDAARNIDHKTITAHRTDSDDTPF